MVLYNILTHHYEKNIHYEFDNDAEELFEEIIDNYNAQFNLKYSTSTSQFSSSQPELDTSESEEIFVHTKAAELVGRVPTPFRQVMLQDFFVFTGFSTAISSVIQDFKT